MEEDMEVGVRTTFVAGVMSAMDELGGYGAEPAQAKSEAPQSLGHTEYASSALPSASFLRTTTASAVPLSTPSSTSHTDDIGDPFRIDAYSSSTAAKGVSQSYNSFYSSSGSTATLSSADADDCDDLFTVNYSTSPPKNVFNFPSSQSTSSKSSVTTSHNPFFPTTTTLDSLATFVENNASDHDKVVNKGNDTWKQVVSFLTSKENSKAEEERSISQQLFESLSGVQLLKAGLLVIARTKLLME